MMSATFKILSYNIFQGGRDQISNIFTFFKNQNASVIGLQEACDWKANKTDKALAHFLGIPDENVIYGNANSGRSSEARVYDLILVSRFPIIFAQVFNNAEEIWHAMIVAMLDSPLGLLQVIVAHLSSRSVEWRMKEIRHLLHDYDIDFSVPTILMGDLNSLSPTDPYPRDLVDELKQQKITKFGNPPKFEEIQTLFNSGFENQCPYSPTVLAAAEDKDHLDLRLDYLLTKNVDRKNILNAQVIDTPETRRLSDHFPVSLTLKS